MSQIKAYTKEKRFPVAPDLYGLFFEDISHAGDGGLYPEMLRNRSFEDSLMPEGCTTDNNGKTFVSPTGWIDEFNNGEGMNDWVAATKIVPTPVPAWYCENATMALDSEDTLNDHRKVSLKTEFQPMGKIWNIGYNGIPQEEGKPYHFYLFVKTEKPVTLIASIEEDGNVSASTTLEIRANGWVRYDASFVASITTGKAIFALTCKEGGCVSIGFTSLMPADTFNGHGLRRDLVEYLRDMNPAFLRFPGGCIVEGFSMETVWYFKNTVGPVWERPSHWLLWHYRATNGLGFHEYLQLCEDLNLAPLYVCNCGMTCQGRMPHFFNEKEQEEMLQDIFDALEYALGPSDSKWGSLRARMGHEAPFRLDYLEIGNENSGPEYEWRFHAIREAVLAKYPDLIIVANEPGREKKLTCDIVDDHYYNMPEFYAENINIYDTYDRSKPGIFVGEFSVNQTYEGQHRAAVAEAMFMIGMERNQDVVRLASYAPLFQHVSYSSWFPNLLIYDNYRSFAIPSYYCWRLFGGSRGKDVVVSEESINRIYYDLHGLPALSGDYGVRFRNLSYNGTALTPSREILGKVQETDGEYMLTEHNEGVNPHYLEMKAKPLCMLGTDLENREGTFEGEAFAEEGKEIAVGILCAPKPLSYYDRTNPNPEDPWTLRFLEVLRWVIKEDEAYVVRGNVTATPISAAKKVNLRMNSFNKIRYKVKGHFVELYLNNELIDTVELPTYPALGSVVTDSDDEVIIKIVNFADTEDDVAITLDCEVESQYHVGLLTADAEAENSIEQPVNVQDQELTLDGADRHFVYHAPALSVNVLTLRKTR